MTAGAGNIVMKLLLRSSISAFDRAIATAETCEPFAHVAWLVEMAGDALHTPSDGKCQAVEIRHDCKHAFVGNVVADENRPGGP